LLAEAAYRTHFHLDVFEVATLCGATQTTPDILAEHAQVRPRFAPLAAGERADP